MKTKLFAFLALTAFGGAAASLAMQPAEATSPVSVEFLEPENYTDFRTSEFGGSKEQVQLEKELRKEIERIAGRYLPPGHHLSLRFRDIDMAGEFEPWHGPRYNDVRIVREIYPPRMEVEYSITNDAGEVVASGTKKISDHNHLWRVRMPSSDQLTYENELLNDFIRDVSRSLT